MNGLRVAQTPAVHRAAPRFMDAVGGTENTPPAWSMNSPGCRKGPWGAWMGPAEPLSPLLWTSLPLAEAKSENSSSFPRVCLPSSSFMTDPAQHGLCQIWGNALHLQTFTVHPPASWAVVGVQDNAKYCSFLQIQDSLLLHPISEHPGKEQQSLTRGFCLVLCREDNAARGLSQPHECQIGLELRFGTASLGSSTINGSSQEGVDSSILCQPFRNSSAEIGVRSSC